MLSCIAGVQRKRQHAIDSDLLAAQTALFAHLLNGLRNSTPVATFIQVSTAEGPRDPAPQVLHSLLGAGHAVKPWSACIEEEHEPGGFITVVRDAATRELGVIVFVRDGAC